MKKHYVKPVMIGEEFSADEFVSACWGIACTLGMNSQNDADGAPHNKWTSGPYNGKGCGHEHNQYVVDNPDGTFSVVEKNTVDGRDLACTITDETYKNEITLSSMANNQLIHWTTTDRWYTYLHYGNVVYTDANRTNHS